MPAARRAPCPEPDDTIVRAEIHPAVGILRVGDATEWYLGPEVSPRPPHPAGSMRVAKGKEAGRLKRQAVKFRVYGYNAAGSAVRELTDDVSWTVHVANRKAAWYQWVVAMDIPEAATTLCPRRNPDVKTAAGRAGLEIDAGPVTIAGRKTSGKRYALSGTFTAPPVGKKKATTVDVALGALETDAAGRLVVIPGKGVSDNPNGAPIFDPAQPNPFINADGRYDDVCDGPVTATVSVDGCPIPCEPAWVLSAPPNYAPDVIGVRTLYDLLEDLYVRAGWLPFPDTVSYRADVVPILRRFADLGWVNKAFLIQYGPAGPFPFHDDAFLARLGGDGPGAAELRRQIVNTVRDPDDPSPDQALWPWIYGDAMTVPAGDSPRQNATVSATQYRILQLWAAGQFERDWDSPADDLPTAIDEVSVADQPGTLTRAALEDALADAFHPGCEVTWPVRHLSMWKAPFRLKHRPAGAPQPDYGSQLSQRDALASFGPLYAQGPGDLSQWMGLPWQADTAFCRSGYDAAYDPYVPTFWPATVPNQVLSETAYQALTKATTPEAQAAAFDTRADWTRFLTKNGDGTGQQMQTMVEIFGSMGVLEQREGPPDAEGTPSVVQVESVGPDAKEPPPTKLSKASKGALKSLRAAPSGKPAPGKTATGKAAAATGKASAAFADVRQARSADLPDDAAFGSAEAGKAAPLPVRHPGSR